MKNTVIAVDNLQLHKIKDTMLHYLSEDIEYLEISLEELYSDHLNRDLTTARLTHRKLSHPNCKPGWFTDREVKYLVELWLANR